MSIRVLFLATYFPRPTNMRMGTWSLDHATALRDSGMDVRVVSLTPWFPAITGRITKAVRTYSDCPPEANLNGIDVDYPRWLCYPIKQCQRLMNRYPGWLMRIGWMSAKRRLLATVRSATPDVVIANHSMVSGYVALQIRNLTGIPYITVDHEVGDFIGCDTNIRRRRLLTSVVEGAATSITVSKAMQTLAESTVPRGRFATIYNGAGFAACPIQLLDRHIDKSNIRIFCCGNLYGRKDVPLLIQAFDQIWKNVPQATLRIAGDGPDRKLIEELVLKLESQNHIHLLGSIDHREVQREMLAADIFALVGWAEPFGVVFLEAMANGCPIIVSEDAGVAEILTDGKSALFTKPRDCESVVSALRELCGSAERRMKIARCGYHLYETSCRWTHRAEAYRDVLEQAAARGNDGGRP